MKATVTSPANIAFIKYWGRKDHKLFLPLTTTNSMNLSSCLATTTVEFSDNHEVDQLTIVGDSNVEKTFKLDIKNKQEALLKFDEKTREIFYMLEKIRQEAGITKNAKIFSRLSFPASAGIASSAAGLSAFTAATLLAAGLKEKFNDKKVLSRYVRKCGSPSAARSVLDGFTELLAADPLSGEITDESSYTNQIASEKHWDLTDITVVTSKLEKKVSSSLGHELANTSPFFQSRIDYLKDKPEKVKMAILDKDFETLASLSEVDWMNMFAVMMTSSPSILYLNSGSIKIYQKVQEMRSEGLEVFTTFDAGPNPHIICTQKAKPSVLEMLKDKEISPFVEFYLTSEPCVGATINAVDLF